MPKYLPDSNEVVVSWDIDYDKDEMKPDDGGEGFIYWWDDMRPREVRELVREVYERGLDAGKKLALEFAINSIENKD